MKKRLKYFLWKLKSKLIWRQMSLKKFMKKVKKVQIKEGIV